MEIVIIAAFGRVFFQPAVSYIQIEAIREHTFITRIGGAVTEIISAVFFEIGVEQVVPSSINRSRNKLTCHLY